MNQYRKPITEDGDHNAINRIARREETTFSSHRARRSFGRHLWDHNMKPELIQQILGHWDVGTTMIYVQPDIVDAFKETKRKVKELEFREAPHQGRSGMEKVSGRNLDPMVCSGRDLDPSRGIESP